MFSRRLRLPHRIFRSRSVDPRFPGSDDGLSVKHFPCDTMFLPSTPYGSTPAPALATRHSPRNTDATTHATNGSIVHTYIIAPTIASTKPTIHNIMQSAWPFCSRRIDAPRAHLFEVRLDVDRRASCGQFLGEGEVLCKDRRWTQS